MDVNGKTAIVTGASRRIGKALALALAERGAKLVLHYGSNSSAAETESVAQTISGAGGEALALQCDLADPRQIETFMDAARSQAGFCSVLVNNASLYGADPDGDFDAALAHWERYMAVNARAPYLLSRWMLTDKPPGAPGKIIMLGDAVAARPRFIAYGTAKAAVSHLTRQMALAGAPDVQVNEVALGHILPPTGAAAPAPPSADSALGRSNAAFNARRLVLRNGAVAEAAQAMLALIDNDYITGETIRVDGGVHV